MICDDYDRVLDRHAFSYFAYMGTAYMGTVYAPERPDVPDKPDKLWVWDVPDVPQPHDIKQAAKTTSK